jgi:hypothetical protein
MSGELVSTEQMELGERSLTRVGSLNDRVTEKQNLNAMKGGSKPAPLKTVRERHPNSSQRVKGAPPAFFLTPNFSTSPTIPMVIKQSATAIGSITTQ